MTGVMKYKPSLRKPHLNKDWICSNLLVMIQSFRIAIFICNPTTLTEANLRRNPQYCPMYLWWRTHWGDRCMRLQGEHHVPSRKKEISVPYGSTMFPSLKWCYRCVDGGCGGWYVVTVHAWTCWCVVKRGSYRGSIPTSSFCFASTFQGDAGSKDSGGESILWISH